MAHGAWRKEHGTVEASRPNEFRTRRPVALMLSCCFNDAGPNEAQRTRNEEQPGKDRLPPSVSICVHLRFCSPSFPLSHFLTFSLSHFHTNQFRIRLRKRQRQRTTTLQFKPPHRNRDRYRNRIQPQPTRDSRIHHSTPQTLQPNKERRTKNQEQPSAARLPTFILSHFHTAGRSPASAARRPSIFSRLIPHCLMDGAVVHPHRPDPPPSPTRHQDRGEPQTPTQPPHPLEVRTGPSGLNI